MACRTTLKKPLVYMSNEEKSVACHKPTLRKVPPMRPRERKSARAPIVCLEKEKSLPASLVCCAEKQSSTGLVCRAGKHMLPKSWKILPTYLTGVRSGVREEWHRRW